MKSLKSLSFIILPILLVVFEADAAEKIMPFTVEWKNELLSVNADDVPLRVILDELSRKTGITIYGPKNLQEPKTVHFTNQTLDHALHDLLKPASYFIIKISTVQEESPSSLILLNKNDDLNNTIVNTLISMSSGTYHTDDMKKEVNDGDVKTIPALQKSAGLAPENVEVGNGPLTLGAKNVPLNIIFSMISRQAGIMIYGSENLQELKTIHFTDLPLDRVLRNLLKPANYYIIHVSATSVESFSPFVLLSKNDDVNNDIINTLISKVTNIYETKALKEDTEAGDGAKRYSAFQKLAGMDSEEDEGITIIKEQLHNPNPEVRITALQTMAYSIDSELALEAAKSAMNDTDAQVRSIAKEILQDLQEQGSEQEGGGSKKEY